jgi:two-component system, cell cycle response regulator
MSHGIFEHSDRTEGDFGMIPIEGNRAADLSPTTTLKVLVAEDDPMLRMILSKLLSGVTDLRLAVDGLEAWKQYQADRPDILLSDWMMPNMSGVELCRRVKASPDFCYVILITARDALDDKVNALECGADEYLVKPVHPRELWARIKAGARILAQHRSLAAENRTDGLTGLRNRRGFEEALGYEIAKSDRAGKPFCLILGDVNQFKTINDQCGHQVGDRVLSAVGTAMIQTLRKIDMVFRLGGDEFAAILPDCPFQGGRHCLTRIHSAMAALQIPEMTEQVGISLGLAVFDPADPVSAESLIGQADKEMYQAKRDLRESYR